ncbi:hypothetical protein DCS_01997 [Drechmeria coniospora]|uniref:Aminoglycoside phosphotransferase domain-containing protein n=1 Tax=Drechmeria coniospora TaxID=98403 RepID=A0A151GUS4_DRECN|nr:hypothetical protein DCS_01997 [Drechmeria coniospora]KYK60859.1 hypothetical protein DCS_01997 [Drechmeria coniospora]ODA83554.1 hypothetical protein RJ55_02068 [Drechmeria coniospora]
MISISIGKVLPVPVWQWIGKKFFRPLGPTVLRVSRHRVIKGPCKQPELEAMLYVAEHTSIPVPKILATFTRHGGLFIEMEYVQGCDLAVAWAGSLLAEDERTTIVAEVKEVVDELRNLAPPEDGIVSSARQNGILDCRIGPRLVGPFSNDDFHSLLRGGVPLECCGPIFGEEVAQIHRRQYRTCFTHADLIPRNIIVRHGHVVAVIDWAFAGWYPEYWEFIKAHYDWFPRPNWYAKLYAAIQCYDAELRAERILWHKYDEPGVPREYLARHAEPASNSAE